MARTSWHTALGQFPQLLKEGTTYRSQSSCGRYKNERILISLVEKVLYKNWVLLTKEEVFKEMAEKGQQEERKRKEEYKHIHEQNHPSSKELLEMSPTPLDVINVMQ